MQDMISKIIKMDEQARKITEEIESDIEKTEEEVKAYRKKIETEYLSRARKRIEKNRVSEQKYSDEILEEIKEKHKVALLAMEEQYDTNFTNWVKQIVMSVVKG